MLDFRPLQLEDLPRLRPYFAYSGSRLCDTTPGTVFIWRDMYRTEYALWDNSLYFKVDYPGVGPTFTLPLGGGRLEQFRQIAEYCLQNKLPLRFVPVPKDELDRMLHFFPGSTAQADRDTFDYLYRSEDLKFFRGKKLSGQRNHVNRFHKTYGTWTFRPIVPEDLPMILALLDRYVQEHEKDSVSYLEDLNKTKEVLNNLDLYDMKGGLLMVEDRLAGFSLGEVLGDTLFIHIEKADREIFGAYQMLVSQFAQAYAGEGVSFLNREDDVGDPGLRTSKPSYHPVALLEKYVVTVPDPVLALPGARP